MRWLIFSDGLVSPISLKSVWNESTPSEKNKPTDGLREVSIEGSSATGALIEIGERSGAQHR
jgi:hypothetical protein